MPALTLTELAGLGQPSREEIRKHASLRPSLRSLEVNQAESDYFTAERDLRRVAEARRRCGDYLSTNRKPETHGFSTGCVLESSALVAASNNLKRAKARLEELRAEMAEQRRASYEVDLRRDARAAPITYVRGASGLSLPTRGLPIAQEETLRRPAPRARRPRRRNRFLFVLGGLAVVGGAAFLLKR